MSIFTKVPILKVPHSTINLSCENTLTMDFGQLVPIYKKRCYPGDKIRMNSTAFVQFMPMLAPVRADIDVFIHHFFVPYRLLWNDFEDFITGGKDGTANPAPPVFDLNNYTSKGVTDNQASIPGSLFDYLNFPTTNLPRNSRHEYDSTKPFYCSSLPFRAYQKIFNDYYRDENLTDEVVINLNSGPESIQSFARLNQLRYRAWRKDYFTSALPFVQRGRAVEVTSSDQLVKLKALTGYTMFLDSSGNPIRDADIKTNHNGEIVGPNDEPIYFDPAGSLGLDGGLFTINDLRNYTAVQRFLEINARGGSRYMESILAHFNVYGNDARLQRAEYLGGGKTPVITSDVKQLSQSTTDSQLGEMAGTAVSAGGDNHFTYNCKEHGILMSIASVLPRSQYFQGVEREEVFADKTEWFFPEFQNLGEQPIYMHELYFQPGENLDTQKEVFGYTPRYAELKFKLNEVHGQMRQSLLHWHLARYFGNKPGLNDEFIRMTPDQAKRIFAVTDTSALSNHLICSFGNHVIMRRPVIKNPIPKLI